ncbi:hypothetical protein [Arthrobacter sp. SD76]|uniref:hypothetical protein n=1 Tax=Arthrobacter sp. SD76 TaxID=3415007 RepID=UPI003C712AAC
MVNSIQSRIKKLPLSSFEHALKFSEEWSSRLLQYEDAVGTDETSEQGLIDWLKPAERQRAKSAAQAALIRQIIDNDDIIFSEFVKFEGRPAPAVPLVTETTYRDKVIKKLRHMAPLREKGEEWLLLRSREAENVKYALNALARAAFLNADGSYDLTADEIERRKRMSYQASLSYVSTLIVRLYMQVLSIDEDTRALLEKEPNDAQLEKIADGIQRIADHPIWTCDFDKSRKTRAVEDALTKNQDAVAAFRAVELRGEYVYGAESLPASWWQ